MNLRIHIQIFFGNYQWNMVNLRFLIEIFFEKYQCVFLLENLVWNGILFGQKFPFIEKRLVVDWFKKEGRRWSIEKRLADLYLQVPMQIVLVLSDWLKKPTRVRTDVDQ